MNKGEEGEWRLISKHLVDDEAVGEGFFRVDGALGDRRRAVRPWRPDLPLPCYMIQASTPALVQMLAK